MEKQLEFNSALETMQAVVQANPKSAPQLVEAIQNGNFKNDTQKLQGG